jgi:hypothetical protein
VKTYLKARITIRVTDEESIRLKELSQVAGISCSDLIRRRCLGITIRTKTDLAAIRELRRLGGLLKSNFQTMREAGTDKNLLNYQEEVLFAVKRAIETLAKPE